MKNRDLRLVWAGALVVLALFLYFWGLGDVPFFTKGEPREGLEVWTEVHEGEWILPLRNVDEIPSKPPLFHWLGGLTALARDSVDEFSVRFPSALLATLALLAVFWHGTRKSGTLAGVFAALILATNFEWLRAATNARVDMTLAACLTATFVSLDVALWSARPPRLALVVAYGSAALAVLAKGPVGLILPAIAGLTYVAIRRDIGVLLKMRPVVGGLVAFAIPAFWYALATVKGGDAFVTKQILAENFGRFLDTEDAGTGHGHPFYYLIGGFFTGFAPWSFFAPALAIELWRRRKTLDDRGLLFPVVWFVTIFVFFSFAEGKRTVYLLPIYPAAAILLGVWWKELAEGTADMPRWLVRALQASGVALVVFVVAVLAIVLAQGAGAEPLEVIRPLLHPKDQANLPVVRDLVGRRLVALTVWAVALLPVLGLFVVGIRSRRWGLAFAALVTFVVSTSSVVQGVFLPALAWQRTFKPFMRVVRAVVTEDDVLSFYRTFDYGAVFYAGRDIPPLENGFGGPAPNGARTYVLMWESEWKNLEPADRERLQFLQQSRGTGPKGRDQLVLALVRVPEDEAEPAEATVPGEPVSEAGVE